jgi:hypothetical protein
MKKKKKIECFLKLEQEVVFFFFFWVFFVFVVFNSSEEYVKYIIRSKLNFALWTLSVSWF